MTIKLPKWEFELQGDEVCSEENCNRPAVYGMERMDGEHAYWCQPHNEIGKLWGQYDWIQGEIYKVKDWHSQVRNTHESAWAGNGGLQHLLILKDEVFDDFILSNKEQHEVTLESLAAALEVACKLTQESIEGIERYLEVAGEYPGDVDDIGD